VPAYAMVVGNPARRIGWMCACGKKLESVNADGHACVCGRKFGLTDAKVGLVPLK
jgi:UDP-2-acetamido-3-amino-2,3-dideoxy-glucuronate N-acetyltransferase